MFGQILLVLMLTPLLNSARGDRNNEQKWICNPSNYCIIDPTPNVGEIQRFESQHDCRLSCGKYGAIWPMPTGNCDLSQKRVHFDPLKVRFNVVAPSPDTTKFIGDTNRQFVSNILKECLKNCTIPDSKEILVKTTVNSSSIALDWTTDESYTVSIRTTATATFVDIRASTVYGARHGFETLSNLVTGCVANGLLMVKNANIDDRPAFPHRGLLLDTARNFIPLRLIQNTLDAMAASKMNVFHWHIVDTQSFPMEVKRVPELQKFGAYSEEQVYTRLDQENIIKYARLRGIRVLIEIDGPSHAGNGWQWGPQAGLGNMAVCINQSPWREFCIEPPCGQLNPLNDNMYATMKKIYMDIAEIGAPEETIHMGGDEVYIPCWNSTKEITENMQKSGLDLSLTSFYKLWSQFHVRNLNSWDDVNKQLNRQVTGPKSVIVWSSHLTDAKIIEQHLPKERFVIQTWVPADDPLYNALLQKGYRLVISTKDAWYLDHGFWGRTSYYNWRKVYNNPLPAKKNVLGGEACMWGEYVDENSVEARIWPRTGAAAERLWSNPKNNASMVQDRFYRYRQRLIARGIRPDAVITKWCVINEGQCF